MREILRNRIFILKLVMGIVHRKSEPGPRQQFIYKNWCRVLYYQWGSVKSPGRDYVLYEVQWTFATVS